MLQGESPRVKGLGAGWDSWRSPVLYSRAMSSHESRLEPLLAGALEKSHRALRHWPRGWARRGACCRPANRRCGGWCWYFCSASPGNGSGALGLGVTGTGGSPQPRAWGPTFVTCRVSPLHHTTAPE